MGVLIVYRINAGTYYVMYAVLYMHAGWESFYRYPIGVTKIIQCGHAVTIGIPLANLAKASLFYIF